MVRRFDLNAVNWFELLHEMTLRSTFSLPLPRNLAKYFSLIAARGGLKAALFFMMETRVPRNLGSMFGSERLPAVENICSQLACTHGAWGGARVGWDLVVRASGGARVSGLRRKVWATHDCEAV